MNLSGKTKPGSLARPHGTQASKLSPGRVQLLPDFVQGWFLLQDAGLDTSEKNMIQSALKNDYRFPRITQSVE